MANQKKKSLKTHARMVKWDSKKTTPTVFDFSIFSMISTYVLDENIRHI